MNKKTEPSQEKTNSSAALADVQTRLVARKDAYNDFGRYKYRSCESILASVKPLLAEHGLRISLSDEIVSVSDRVYIKATCTVSDSEGQVVETTVAYAREELAKKGMDASQCTGSASSYARKYALCGMFAIDDSSTDPDATNDHKAGAHLTDDERLAVINATSEAQLSELCRKLVEAGRDRGEVTKAYSLAKSGLKAAHA